MEEIRKTREKKHIFGRARKKRFQKREKWLLSKVEQEKILRDKVS
jgi:hypothetical protein